MASRPKDPEWLRVACVQLDFEPSLHIQGVVATNEPLHSLGGPALVPSGALTPEMVQRWQAQAEAHYLAHLRARVRTILEAARSLGVEVLVLPEGSIPAQILADTVQPCAGAMTIVAGTHTSRLADVEAQLYRRLGFQGPVQVGANVAPVFVDGRLQHVQPKLHPAEPEREGFVAGTLWDLVAVPTAGDFAVLTCLDYIHRESALHRGLVAEQLAAADLVLVPSYTSTSTAKGEFAAQAEEDARRHKRPVVFANVAKHGESAIVTDTRRPLPRIPPGEEGMLVADVRIRSKGAGRSTPYEGGEVVRLVVDTRFVYRAVKAHDALHAELETSFSPALDEAESDPTQFDKRKRRELAEWLQRAIQASSGSRRNRLARLATLLEVQPVSATRRQLRDIWFSPALLPMDLLRHARAAGLQRAILAMGAQPGDEEILSAARKLSTPPPYPELTKAAREALGRSSADESPTEEAKTVRVCIGDDATIERLRRSSATRSLEVLTPTRNWHINEPLGSRQWRCLDSRLAALPDELERGHTDEVDVFPALPYALAARLAVQLAELRIPLRIHQFDVTRTAWVNWGPRGVSPADDGPELRALPHGDVDGPSDDYGLVLSVTHAANIEDLRRAVAAAGGTTSPPILELAPPESGPTAFKSPAEAMGWVADAASYASTWLATKGSASRLHLFCACPVQTWMRFISAIRRALPSKSLFYERVKRDQAWTYRPALRLGPMELVDEGWTMADGTRSLSARKVREAKGPTMTNPNINRMNFIEPWDDTLDPKERVLIESSHLNDQTLEAARDRLQRLGICQLRIAGLAPAEEHVRTLAAGLGALSTSQNHFHGDVKRLEPTPDGQLGSGDTAKLLGFHVDGTQHETTPALLIFNFVQEPVGGANSIFVDIARALQDLDVEERENLIATLARPDAATFAKRGLQHSGPVFFALDGRAVGCRVRFDDVISVHAECKTAFERLRSLCEDPRMHLTFKPRPADYVVFDNRRLLHARDEVFGFAQRSHLRAWVQEVKASLRPRFWLGIRPISPRLLSRLEDLQGS